MSWIVLGFMRGQLRCVHLCRTKASKTRCANSLHELYSMQGGYARIIEERDIVSAGELHIGLPSRQPKHKRAVAKLRASAREKFKTIGIDATRVQ